MTFFTIVVRGLQRRPVRTGLTLVGISIGIAAVVALVGISRGFEASWASGMKVRGTDIVVSNMGSALAPKPFSATVRDRIAKLPQVAAACSIYADLTSVEDASMMVVSAREWGGFSWQNLKLISGRMPHDAMEPAVVLGQTAAEVLKKKVGDPLQLESKELIVTGIVDGGAMVENGSVILSLALFQSITGNEGRINVIDIRATPGLNEEEIKHLCEQINTIAPEARAMVAGEHLGNSQAFRFISAMSWGTSLLDLMGIGPAWFSRRHRRRAHRHHRRQSAGDAASHTRHAGTGLQRRSNGRGSRSSRDCWRPQWSLSRVAQLSSDTEPCHAGLILTPTPLMKTLLHLFCMTLLAPAAYGGESAIDLAAKLGALQQDGASLVRLKMDVRSSAKFTLQLQIKQRRTGTTTEVVYQVLWPKERAGEAVLLRKTGDQAATGAVFTPPSKVHTLDSSQMKEALLGSDLSYADGVENFFLWKQQAIIGTEIVNRVSCDILESKPGKGQRSSYASVRTWVDSRRDVPLRIEKYLASGQLVRRIDTTRVATNDKNQSVPANLTVSDIRQGSTTELNGASVKHGVNFSDREFTPAGFMEVVPVRAATN